MRIKLKYHGKGLFLLYVKGTWYELSTEEVTNLREELEKEEDEG